MPTGYFMHSCNDEAVSIDFEKATYHFELDADQGFALAQTKYGFCLQKGEGVSIDFQGAAHYCKLAAGEDIALPKLLLLICCAREESHDRGVEYSRLQAVRS
jgi:TPR repeat protein